MARCVRCRGADDLIVAGGGETLRTYLNRFATSAARWSLAHAEEYWPESLDDVACARCLAADGAGFREFYRPVMPSIRHQIEVDVMLADAGYRRVPVPMDGRCAPRTLSELLRFGDEKLMYRKFLAAVCDGGEPGSLLHRALSWMTRRERVRVSSQARNMFDKTVWNEEVFDNFILYAQDMVRAQSGVELRVFVKYDRPRLAVLTPEGGRPPNAAVVRYCYKNCAHIEPCVLTVVGMVRGFVAARTTAAMDEEGAEEGAAAAAGGTDIMRHLTAAACPVELSPVSRFPPMQTLVEHAARAHAAAGVTLVVSRWLRSSSSPPAVTMGEERAFHVFLAADVGAAVLMRFEPLRHTWVACILTRGEDADKEEAWTAYARHALSVAAGERALVVLRVHPPKDVAISREALDALAIVMSFSCAPVFLERSCREAYSGMRGSELWHFRQILADLIPVQ